MAEKPEDQEDDTSPARQRRDFRNFQSVIDQLVGEAREKGHFDTLDGTGKPLAEPDDAHVAEEDRLAFRMLKSHGFSPPWMEARRDIDQERERAETWLRRTNKRWSGMQPASQAVARREYRTMLQDIRRLILNYNLTAPAAAGQIEGIDIEQEMQRLGNML